MSTGLTNYFTFGLSSEFVVSQVIIKHVAKLSYENIRHVLTISGHWPVVQFLLCVLIFLTFL